MTGERTTCPRCGKPVKAKGNENWTVYCGPCGVKVALEEAKKSG